jgi:multidrug resistance efflux pump
MMTSEEILDLLDKLDSKIEELDEQINNQQLKVNSSDGDVKERRVVQLIELKNEKHRINNIINQHLTTLRKLENG